MSKESIFPAFEVTNMMFDISSKSHFRGEYYVLVSENRLCSCVDFPFGGLPRMSIYTNQCNKTWTQSKIQIMGFRVFGLKTHDKYNWANNIYFWAYKFCSLHVTHDCRIPYDSAISKVFNSFDFIIDIRCKLNRTVNCRPGMPIVMYERLAVDAGDDLEIHCELHVGRALQLEL